MTTPFRLCNAAGCVFRTVVNSVDPDAAWDTVTDHYQADHGMTGSQAAYFGSWHSRTEEDPLPPWEETVKEAAAWDRQWDNRDDDSEEYD